MSTINLDDRSGFDRYNSRDDSYGYVTNRDLLREALKVLKEINKLPFDITGNGLMSTVGIERCGDIYVRYLEQLLNTK